MTLAAADPYVCVGAGTPGECQNCGGWTGAGGGPFEPDPRFCSEECFEDSMEFQERARLEASSSWCSECGFDRHEHQDGCGRRPPAS